MRTGGRPPPPPPFSGSSRDAVTGTRAATPEEAALIRVDLMPAHQDRCAAPLICVERSLF